MTLLSLFFLTIICLLDPIDASAKVIINEVLPNPDDEVEAVELTYVPQEEDSQEMNLLGWTISNNRAVIHTFEEETLITENDFFVFTFYRKLLNTGDSIIIKDDNQIIVDEFHYTDTQKGLSYSRVNYDQADFIETTPSLGKANNVVITPTPSPTVTTQEDDHNLTKTDKEICPDNEEASNSDSLSASLIDSKSLNQSEDHQSENSESFFLDEMGQKELLANIMAHKEYLDSQLYNKPMALPSQQPENFLPISIFEASHASSSKILSVIIGGLLFFISSRLIYE